MNETDEIEDRTAGPRPIRRARMHGIEGTIWAWPFDGYWDLHFVAQGERLDGSEPIAECIRTLQEAKAEARMLATDYETMLFGRRIR